MSIKAWFMGLNFTTRAAIIAGGCTIVSSVLSVAGTLWVTNLMKPPTRIETFAPRVELGKFRQPPKLAKGDLKQLEGMNCLSVFHLPNSGSLLWTNVVIRLPRSGVYEILDEDDEKSTTGSFNRRLVVPIVPPMSTKTVYIWHSDPLLSDEPIHITTNEGGKSTLFPPNADDYLYYERFFRMVKPITYITLVVILVWLLAKPLWKLLLKWLKPTTPAKEPSK